MIHTPKSPFVIPVSRDLRRRAFKAVSVAVQVAVVASLTLSGGFGLGIHTAIAGGGGSIKTTAGSCGTPVNQNHYSAGDHIIIHGEGFDAGSFAWSIEGNPGGASGDPGLPVASGTQIVASGSPDFCFDAYTVAGDDWGEYQVKFAGAKGDNYRVDGATVGSIVLTKVVDSGSASTDSFSFTISPDTRSVGTVSTTSGTYTFDGLDPTTTYTITEGFMSGYHQVSNTCDDISVTAGLQTLCTIHNARDTQAVTIVKNVVGGTAQASDWTFTLTGTGQDQGTFAGIQSGVPVTVPTGTYALSESGPSGYVMSIPQEAGNCYNDGGFFLYTNVEGTNTCTVTNTYVPTPANLTIAKTDNRTTANPGDVLTYQITLTNTGDTGTITPVRVSDTVPAFVTNVTSISDSGTLSASTVTWDNLSVPGHGSKIVSFTGTVASTIPAGTTVLHNIANLGCSPVTPPRDIVTAFVVAQCAYTGTATDDTSVTVVAPALTITKTNDSGSFVNPGATVNYTVVVKNSATATQSAASVVLSDTLPAGFTYTVGGGTTKTWNLGSIAPGASVTTTYAAAVSSSQSAGTYTNTAAASASNAATVSATSAVVVKVPQVLGIENPDLAILKEVNDKNPNAGDVISYTVTVKALGNSDALNTVVSDTLPAGLTFVTGGGTTRTWNLGTLAVGTQKTIVYDVKIASTIKAGTYTNTATVTADGVNPRTDKVDVQVKVPQVLGLATTGTGTLDYALFTLGALLVGYGAISLARERRLRAVRNS